MMMDDRDILSEIKKYVSESVKPIDFVKILTEADDDAPKDDAPADGGADASGDDSPGDLGGGDPGGGDGGGEDLGGDAGGFDDAGGSGGGFDDFGGGDAGGFGGDSGSDGSTGSVGDDTQSSNEDKYADREDDPDFTKGPSDPSASPADAAPSGTTTYQVENVLSGLNKTIMSNEVDLSELEAAKKVIELISNGKKLLPEDFKDIINDKSFTDIVKRSLEGADDRTKNYYTMKIREGLQSLQIDKKVETSKSNSELDKTRDLMDGI